MEAVLATEPVRCLPGPGEAMLSSTVRDLVAGSGLRFNGPVDWYKATFVSYMESVLVPAPIRVRL